MTDLFREAVKAAKNGERKRARNLLLELVQGQPRHEMAWLWLSEMVDDLEDKIIALENALTTNPGRAETIHRLEQLRQQQLKESLQSWHQDLYQDAVTAYKNGRRQQARELLQELVAKEPRHEKAWLGLSRLVDAVEEQIIALERVLDINPNHQKAQERLTQLQRAHDNNLALGRAYEESGLLDKAITAYKLAEKNAASVTDRTIARQRRQAAEKQQKQTRTVQVTSPTANLIRLASGPVLIYGLLLFIHSGLNPLRISLPLLLSGVGVVVGSLLLVGTANTPHHPFWKRLLGPEGIADKQTQLAMSVIGLVLMLIPFGIMIISAMNRLEQYRAVFSSSFN